MKKFALLCVVIAALVCVPSAEASHRLGRAARVASAPVRVVKAALHVRPLRRLFGGCG